MANSKFNTPTKRARLTPRREPYWHQLDAGRFIGYRKTETAGSWVARLGRRQHSLGSGLMEWPEAVAAVNKWCDSENLGENAPHTVSDAIDGYLEAVRIEKGLQRANEARATMRNHVPPALAARQVKDLRPADLVKWRDNLVRDGDAEEIRASKSSANRLAATLKAALNRSYALDLVADDKAWRTLKRFTKAEKARTLFLTDDQVRRLRDTTAGAFHDLCMAGILTGARIGELRAAKAADLNPGDGTLHLDGKTGPRDVFLSDEALAFYRGVTRNSLPAAPLLPAPQGGHWCRPEVGAQMKRAVVAARMPQETVYYSLRHYHISKAVKGGLSLLAIAKNTGTSVAQIEKTYGKFTPEDMRRLMGLVELG